MNRLRNKDTHAGFMPAALSGPHWSDHTVNTMIPWVPGHEATVEIRYPQIFENEVILGRCSHGATVEYDTKPAIDIVFSDVEFLKGKSVLNGLRGMIDLTERIIQIFERHFF